MGQSLKVMDMSKGHTVTPFSPKDHKEAEAKFDEIMGGDGRFVAYNVVTHGGRRLSEETKTFDPEAKVTIEKKSGNVEKPVEEVLLVPPMAGGS